MNHSNNQPPEPEPADLAMQQVLRAEREAEQAVSGCGREVSEMLKATQQRAQHLAARTNNRISLLQTRFNQKLNRAIHDIEQADQTTTQTHESEQAYEARLGHIIDELAAELTTLIHVHTKTEQ